VNITRIGPVFGAEVSGVDLRAPVDEEVIASVREAFVTHEVLVFRGQDLSGDDMIALGSSFGELLVNPFSPNAADQPQLIILDNHDANPPALTDVWHADETFRAAPPAFTMLHSLIATPLGGGTMFASMRAAYDLLSDRMKAHIAGLTARHDFGRFDSLFPDSPDARRTLHEIELQHPHPSHPVVRIHPETGRPVLYVNNHFTRRINELPEDEGKAILQYLLSRTDLPEIQLRVQWEAGTLVMWDNRSVQHYAVHDYYPQRRRMQRVTVSGDVPQADSEPPSLAAPHIVVADPPVQSDADSVPRQQIRRQFERAHA